MVVRIAVTGGPGAGKTTLWRDLASAHAQRVLALPEVATLMFSHVFPQVRDEEERRSVQCAIFEVQRQLESVYERRLLPGQLLLCDRGLPDGGGYWPDGHEAFFETMGTQWQAELARYDAVLFMESAAVGGLSIAAGNATRREDEAAATRLNARLHAVWAQHPRFHHVPHELDFAVKVARARQVVESWIHAYSGA
jgi:predicted ATPase